MPLSKTSVSNETHLFKGVAGLFCTTKDEAHSTSEEAREIIIGHSQQNRLLLVAFTERAANIRIISARLATRQEREDYELNT
ncbi:MAG: BrnT family toxin [Leptolyngbyaceae cyanobacterium]